MLDHLPSSDVPQSVNSSDHSLAPLIQAQATTQTMSFLLFFQPTVSGFILTGRTDLSLKGGRPLVKRGVRGLPSSSW